MSALIAWAKPGRSVRIVAPCGCRYDVPHDPPFGVDCPACGANVGAYCKRPSEHSGPLVPFHAARDLAAVAVGLYDGCDCPKGVRPLGPSGPGQLSLGIG